MFENTGHDGLGRRLSRRQVLRGLALGATGLALLPAGHFNTFEAKSIFGFTPTVYWDFFETPLAMWRWADAKWEYMLAQDSKVVPPDQIQVTLRSGLKWS